MRTGAEAWAALQRLAEFVAHPACALFPAHDGKAIEELAEDITQRGQLHAIVLDAEGQVLSGRGRWAACLLAGVTPRFEPTQLEGLDAVGRVVAEELHRRHMSGIQLGAALLALEEIRESIRAAAQAPRSRGEDGRLLPRPGGAAGKTRERLAKMVDISPRAAGHLLTLADQDQEALQRVAGGQALGKEYRRHRKERTSDAEREADRREWRRTPPWVMHALCDGLLERPGPDVLVWDPFAGEGDLQRAAAKRGWRCRWLLGELRSVCQPELQRFADEHTAQVELLMGDLFSDELAERGGDLFGRVEMVVMNPPFSLAREAVERVWQLAFDADVYMLQRRGWVDQARAEWLAEHEPDELKLRKRVRFGQANGEYYAGTDNTLHSWYFWERLGGQDRAEGRHRFLPLPDTYPGRQ